MGESSYYMSFKERVKDFLDKNFPAVFMFYKLDILLFLSLLNMITASVGGLVGGRLIGGSLGKWSVVGESVVGGFNKIHSKGLDLSLKL